MREIVVVGRKVGWKRHNRDSLPWPPGFFAGQRLCCGAEFRLVDFRRIFHALHGSAGAEEVRVAISCARAN